MDNYFFFLIFLFLNLLIFLFYKKIHKYINVYDYPDSLRKIHKIKTPVFGGVIFFINFLFYILLNFFFPHYLNLGNFFNIFFKNNIFYIISFLIFFLGIYDDKKNITPNIKFFLLSILLYIYIIFDNQNLITEIRFSFYERTIYLEKLSFFLTLLCFLLFINACNMFDGVNLQSSMYFFIIYFYFFIISDYDLFFLMCLFSIICIIFLNYNGKIFIGDGGIYLFSFIASSIFVKLFNNSNIKFSDQIFIFMMLPGFDLLRLFVYRILNKKNPFKPDKKHIHHLLIDKFGFIKTIFILFFLVVSPIIMSFYLANNLYIIIFFLIIYLMLIAYTGRRNNINI